MHWKRIEELLEHVAIDGADLPHCLVLVRGASRLPGPGNLLLAHKQALDPLDVLHLVHDQEARAIGLLFFFICCLSIVVDDLSTHIFELQKGPRLHGRLSIAAIIVGLKM